MSSKKYDDVSIFYDKQRDRYEAKVTLEKGKPRVNVRGKTEEEVLLKARQLLYGSRDEKFILQKGMPLIELVKLNFSRRDNAGQFKAAQYNRTLYVIKQIENSKIGSVNVQELTERDYQDFFNELSQNYADSSIDKCYAEIHQALKYAKKKKMILDIPLEDIIKPKSKKPKKEIIPLTVEQQKILSDFLFSKSIDEYKYKNVFLIQMYMGLRIGEALTLKRKDIDLKKRTIHIERTLTDDRNGKSIIGEVPKTDAGNRVIPIPDIVFDIVKEQEKISRNNKDELLFCYGDKLITHSAMNSQLKIRLTNLGIFNKDISTHSLRHTYATRCIESGMQAVVLSKLLGHSDIRVTLNTYVKIFNEYQAKASKSVEDYYKNIELMSPDSKENEDDRKIIQFPRRIANEYFDR